MTILEGVYNVGMHPGILCCLQYFVTMRTRLVAACLYRVEENPVVKTRSESVDRIHSPFGALSQRKNRIRQPRQPT